MDWRTVSAHDLLNACVASERGGAWEEFIRRYHSVIIAAAIRVSNHWGSGTPEEIDDVVQEVYLKLYAERRRLFATFQSPHSDAIFAFVKVVATNAARDYFRHKAADKRGMTQTEGFSAATEKVGSPDLLDLRVTISELERFLIANTEGEGGARDRAIFQLYYRDGMTALAISRLPGVGLNPKGVEGVLHRLLGKIRMAVNKTQEMGAS